MNQVGGVRLGVAPAKIPRSHYPFGKKILQCLERLPQSMSETLETLDRLGVKAQGRVHRHGIYFLLRKEKRYAACGISTKNGNVINKKQLEEAIAHVLGVR